MKPDIGDLEQCVSCDGYFDHEKIESNGDDNFCTGCYDDFKKAIRQEGVNNLDEYLESRGLKNDFWVFSHAKFSAITEEEFKELHPD